MRSSFFMPLLLMGVGLFFTQASRAAPSAAAYTEGEQYVTLPAAQQQRYSRTGKVEVVEVFSYGCIHCKEFAPFAERLRQQLPPGVVFKLVPAAFNDVWMPFAQAYYAAKYYYQDTAKSNAGKAAREITYPDLIQQTHLALFREKFDQHYPINTLDELADFYQRHAGVDPKKFLQIARSKQVTEQIRADSALIQKWQVDGTPTIMVDGKYRSANVHNLEDLVGLTRWLVKRELAKHP